MQDPGVTKLPPGTEVGGRYRIVAQIAAGSMGTVYRVEHTAIRRELALKLLHPDMSAIVALRERFNREARSMAMLEHPNIVQVTDFGTAESGELYMVMELLKGPTLGEVPFDQMPHDRAFAVHRQILDALAHAHERGIVHRDLKPGNVMLVGQSGRETVKILDFGLAGLLQPTEGEPALTQAGAVFGTPLYMSPEQAAGEKVDGRTDLYAAALLLHEMLTGRVMFEGENAAETLGRQITEAPNVDLPDSEEYHRAGLEGVLLQALAKHPRDRYHSAAELQAAIDRTHTVSGDETVEAAFREIGTSPPARLGEGVWATGSRVKLVVAAMVLALVAGIFAVVVARRGPDVSEFEQALARREFDKAEILARQMIVAHPESATAHLAHGHALYEKKRRKAALGSYAKALELDPNLVVDTTFEFNVRSLVEHKDPLLEPMTKHLAVYGGKSAAPLLLHIVRFAYKPAPRRLAYEGLERLDEFGDLERYDYLRTQLERNPTSSCAIRKWYMERLLSVDRERAAVVLEREVKKPSMECMADLEDAHLINESAQ